MWLLQFECSCFVRRHDKACAEELHTTIAQIFICFKLNGRRHICPHAQVGMNHAAVFCQHHVYFAEVASGFAEQGEQAGCCYALRR